MFSLHYKSKVLVPFNVYESGVCQMIILCISMISIFIDALKHKLFKEYRQLTLVGVFISSQTHYSKLVHCPKRTERIVAFKISIFFIKTRDCFKGFSRIL